MSQSLNDFHFLALRYPTLQFCQSVLCHCSQLPKVAITSQCPGLSHGIHLHTSPWSPGSAPSSEIFPPTCLSKTVSSGVFLVPATLSRRKSPQFSQSKQPMYRNIIHDDATNWFCFVTLLIGGNWMCHSCLAEALSKFTSPYQLHPARMGLQIESSKAQLQTLT